MSLILEALKKSETRRRLGEAPDIGTPFTVKSRRRNPWPLIAIAIAVAAGVGWWYARTMPRPNDANTVVSLPSPPAPPAVGKGAADARQTQTPAAKAGAAVRESAGVQSRPRPDGSVAGPAAKPPARADAGAAGVTAPGGVDAQALRPVTQHFSLPATPPPAPATVNPNPANVPAAAAQAPIGRATPPSIPAAPAPARPPAEPAVAPPAQPPTAATAQPAVAPPPASAAPAVPQYYELAYALRKDIPQFNLSMHVFAPDAAARFVVVDGERKVEGDTVKEGLVLREVRTDGIILEFRGQRFFYPRPGH
jgi:general secretion pathway protein B